MWSEIGRFPPCSTSDGSCGEFTVSQMLQCSNPTPSTGGRKCSCNFYLTDCNGLTATYSNDCNPMCVGKYIVYEQGTSQGIKNQNFNFFKQILIIMFCFYRR